MRLTRRKLIQQDNSCDWQASEFLQLNQYDAQGMFGEPVQVDQDDAVFFLVWTYGVKTLDGREEARCVCDGLSQSCENIQSWISRSGDLVFSHHDGIYGFKFSSRFSEISCRDLTLFLLFY